MSDPRQDNVFQEADRHWKAGYDEGFNDAKLVDREVTDAEVDIGGAAVIEYFKQMPADPDISDPAKFTLFATNVARRVLTAVYAKSRNV